MDTPCDNRQPELASGEDAQNPTPMHAEQCPSVAAKKRRNWGGRRPGAGAPRGNLNGFKHGRRSRQLADAVAVLAANPKTRDTLIALGIRAGLKQSKAEHVALRFFVNAMTKGVKVQNSEQARALTSLIREMGK